MKILFFRKKQLRHSQILEEVKNPLPLICHILMVIGRSNNDTLLNFEERGHFVANFKNRSKNKSFFKKRNNSYIFKIIFKDLQIYKTIFVLFHMKNILLYSQNFFPSVFCLVCFRQKWNRKSKVKYMFTKTCQKSLNS